MTTNKVPSESPFYFQLIHVNNIWNIKTVFMQNGYRLQWYGIFPLFLIQYLAQLGLLIVVICLDHLDASCRFEHSDWMMVVGPRSGVMH